MGSLMLHLGPIWYHSLPSDVPDSQNLPRPISWFGLFLQQNDSKEFCNSFFVKICDEQLNYPVVSVPDRFEIKL